jgi:hypothetical protein
MIKPFTPDEALAQKHANIPDFVIDAINKLLAKTVQNGHSQFKQDDAVDAILANMPEDLRASLSNDHERRQYVFTHKLLDFEPLYREHGWTVVYDKQSYGDTSPSSYTFSRKR